MLVVGALGFEGVGVYVAIDGVVDVEFGGVWSLGSGVYYSLNDKIFCVELYVDSV